MPDEVTPQSRLRLTGGRYEAVGFPVEGLPELVQYERLVMDVAKAVWLRAHPGRKRVPKGFAEAVNLRLLAVTEGSTIPVLARTIDRAAVPEVDAPGVLDEAQNLIDRAFLEIVANNRLPEDFPDGLTNHFLRLGRTLQSTEALEFGLPNHGSKARYTQSVRKKFLTATQDEDFPVDGLLAGQITALDTNALTFSITDLRGGIVPASYADESLTPDLKAVFDRKNDAPIVRLDCTQLIGQDERVSRVEDIRSIEVFVTTDEFPGRSRLLELLRLQKGWLDGEGEPVDLLALERARDLLEFSNEGHLPLPGIFPRLDGGVQVQWITESDVWTAVLNGEDAIAVDYLAVELDQAGESIVETPKQAAAFFVQRLAEIAR